MKKHILFLSGLLCLVLLPIYLFPVFILAPLASCLITEDPPERVDAVIVLNTGIGIYERLMEAAYLYNQDYTAKIIINGNRKNEILKELEEMGLQLGCAWDEERIRVLELLGVPRKAIISISAEDAYDTVTEAEAVGPKVISMGLKKIIITTSKVHSARAIYIWRTLFTDRLSLLSITAKKDLFLAEGWWRSGKDTKQLLYEYGSWLYLFAKKWFIAN